jgi:two-component system chemotaxis response regulator CheB
MRPSIDVLFRSAAGYCTTRVIAVLLTGCLDDGVSGLAAVKRCGGIAIVQDPAEAEAPEMPQTAISKVEIDHVLPLEGIARKIIALSGEPAGAIPDVPEDIMTDIKNSEYNIPDLEEMEKLGRVTPFTCPECGGVMWKRDNEPIARYVCHTGHSFTEKSLLEGQSKVIEYSLWKAIRHLEERVKILRTMAEGDREKGKSKSAVGLGEKADDLKHHADIIRDFIVSGKLTSLGEAKITESAL